MKKAALICSIFLFSIIAVLAVSCGGGGGGAIAATGGNNAGKRGFGGGSGSEGVKVFVNGTQVAGSNSESSSGKAENASTASYSEGIMSLDWSTMDLKLWVNGQLYFNQTLNKGDKFSIAGLKLGDSVRAEGTFQTSDGKPYLITGGIPSVQNGSKLSMYVTYTWTCSNAGMPAGTKIADGASLSGTYTAEAGAVLPAIQCLNGKKVEGWLNTTPGLSSDGKVWKTIPPGTTGNLTFAIDGNKSLSGNALFNVSGTTITGFADGVSLSTVTIPEGVTDIAENAFKENSIISSITFPSTLKTIGLSAFQQCTNLGSVKFAENSQLTSLGPIAFYGTGLVSIVIPEGVKTIRYDCFNGCEYLTSVKLPSTITSIETKAFTNCKRLATLTIPNKVTNIASAGAGNDPFYNCGLSAGGFTLTMESTVPVPFASAMNFGSTPIITIKVPASAVDVYKAASGWSDHAAKIVGY